MGMTAQHRLQLPRGVRSLPAAAALAHRRTTAACERVFDLWGYSFVMSPPVDYFDIYRPLLERGFAEQVYRLVDRDGQILMIRPDVTLFLAKQLANARDDSSPVARVYYSDVILRHQPAGRFQPADYHQTGIELIGEPSIEGDAETLVILDDALASLEIDDAAIHIGSRAFAAACLGLAPDRIPEEVLSAIVYHDSSTVGDLLPQPRRAYLDALFFVGSPAEWRTLVERLPVDPAGPVGSAADEVQRVAQMVGEAGVRLPLYVDPSEVGTRPYYTGITFAAYRPKSPEMIAAGGRYDGLYRHFGCDVSAVGFSVFTGRAVPPDESVDPPDSVTGANFQARVDAARRHHAQNRRAQMGRRKASET